MLLEVSAAWTDAAAAPCRAPSPLNRHRAAVAVPKQRPGTSLPAGRCSPSRLAAGNGEEAAETGAGQQKLLDFAFARQSMRNNPDFCLTAFQFAFAF